MKSRFSISNAAPLKKAPSIYQRREKRPKKLVRREPAPYPPVSDDLIGDDLVQPQQATPKKQATPRTPKQKQKAPSSARSRSQASSTAQKESQSCISPSTKAEPLIKVARPQLPPREELLQQYQELADAYVEEIRRRKQLETDVSSLKRQVANAYREQVQLEKRYLEAYKHQE